MGGLGVGFCLQCERRAGNKAQNFALLFWCMWKLQASGSDKKGMLRGSCSNTPFLSMFTKIRYKCIHLNII